MWPDHAIITASRHQLASDLGSETVVLDTEGGHYWGLDPISTRILEIVQEPRSVAQVIAVLLEEFDVSPERCERDVRDALGKMEQAKLVHVDREGA